MSQQTVRERFDSHDFRLWFALMLLLSDMSSAFAQGGPPMLTDDPGTPGAGTWELNFAYREERTSQERLRSVPYFDINYGLGEQIQLKYETRWLLSDAADGGGTQSGLDNSLFGVKWRFLDQDSNGVDMSVYPQVELENFTGSVSRGIAEPGPNLFLPFEIGRDFGKVKLAGELGYQYLHAQDNEWVVGVLGAVQASENLEFMAEVRNTSDKLLNGGDVIGNVGLRQVLSPKLKLVASVGTGLNNRTDATTFTTYIGVQIVLGKK